MCIQTPPLSDTVRPSLQAFVSLLSHLQETDQLEALEQINESLIDLVERTHREGVKQNGHY